MEKLKKKVRFVYCVKSIIVQNILPQNYLILDFKILKTLFTKRNERLPLLFSTRKTLQFQTILLWDWTTSRNGSSKSMI